jgi:DNA topoisomerase-1
MTKKLVIVESPAKAKTIGKILGADFVVKASMGHIRDLPVKGIGIAFDKDFEPRYEVTPDRVKIVKELQAVAKDCEEIFLAPDPDREGEAIAWHLETLLKEVSPDAKFHRVTYNEITPRAVREAFSNPSDLNMKLVDAQQARRILDRIVGYKVSPLLWSQIQRNTSAGRVQSVALRLVCEREQAIRIFKPETYWLMGADVRKQTAPVEPFTVRLARVKGEKADIRSVELADSIRADLETRRLRVKGVIVRELSRRAYAPFITSTLQQAGSRVYNYSPSRTMRIAQELYEGVDLGEGPAGLITYMRTDSVNISRDAQDACRQFIGEHFGAAYVPEKPNIYRSRGSAQEAHEAVRPTEVSRTPESLQGKIGGDEWKLYSLIWQRFVASQMTPAKIEQNTAEVETETAAGAVPDYLFRATASQVTFPGYMAAFGEKKPKAKDPEKAEDDKPAGPEEEPEVDALPPLQPGEPLDVLKWLEDRKETQPPNRYSEATLIKALEEEGVGRPSTYAQILGTLNVRRYVIKEKQKRALFPTPLGEKVNTLLVATLNELFDVTFTAAMEKKLDAIEEGQVGWREMLHTFYDQFQIWMEKAKGPPADTDHVRQLIELLGQVKEWAPGVASGAKGKIKGDAEFVASVDKQLKKATKPISSRQLEALGRRICRYRDQIPGAVEGLQGMGLGALLEEPPPQPPSEATQRKLALLTAIEHDAPETRRGRTYDDKAFIASLKQRADGGKELTPAQAAALDRLVVKYADRIPNFEQEREHLALGAEGEGAGGPPDPELKAIVDRMLTVQAWDEPKKKGKRTFDDKVFFDSLARQFAQRGRLSPKQVAALKKMDKRYHKPAEGAEGTPEGAAEEPEKET